MDGKPVVGEDGTTRGGVAVADITDLNSDGLALVDDEAGCCGEGTDDIVDDEDDFND